MFKLKMIGAVGSHDLGPCSKSGEHKYAKAGDVFESEVALHDKFPDKFMLVSESEAPAKGKAKGKKEASKDAVSGDAIDITARFPSAESNGLSVLATDGTFSIVKGEEVLVDGLANEALVVSEIDDILSEK